MLLSKLDSVPRLPVLSLVKSPPIMTINQQLHTSAVLNIYTGARSVDTVLSLSDQVPLIGSNAPRQPVWLEAKYCTLPLELNSLSNLSGSFTTFQVFSVSLRLM